MGWVGSGWLAVLESEREWVKSMEFGNHKPSECMAPGITADPSRSCDGFCNAVLRFSSRRTGFALHSLADFVTSWV